MVTPEIAGILRGHRRQGWVMEPEAKRLLSLVGLPVPRYRWAKEEAEALQFAGEIGYPVVAKVVSPEIMHKSDQGGVVAGIADPEALRTVFQRFRLLNGFDGLLVEEMASGLELMVGGKIDYQFGPVILLGLGGTRAEIYRDRALRLAPLSEDDVAKMAKSLRAHRLLEGYRGEAPVNMPALSRLLLLFSRLIVELGNEIESIDLNPLFCNEQACVIADARIILGKGDAVEGPDSQLPGY